MDTKSNNIIDQLVREKLEFFEADFQPGSWELFENKLQAENLDASGSEANGFDDAVYNKIHAAEVPFDPVNWAKMDFRLDQEFIFSTAILRYKLIELSLVLLAFFFIRPFSQNNQAPVNSRIYAENELPASQYDNQATRTAPLLEEKTVNDIGLEKVSSPTTDLAGGLDDQSGSSSNDFYKGAISGSSPNAPDAIFSLNHLPYRLLDIPFRSREYFTIPSFESSVSLISGQEKTLDFLQGNEIALLADPSNVASLLANVIHAGKKHFLRFSMLGGPEVLQIITPVHVFSGDAIEEGKNYSYGYSGGLTAGFGKGRFEIETGFMYSSKSYNPLPVLFFNGSLGEGYYGEGFKRVEYNIVSIPLNFHYTFLKKGKWSAYGTAGISGQFVMQSNLYQADQEEFARAGFHPPPVNRGGSRYTALDAYVKSEKSILEGGSLRENTFFGVNAGFGVERYIFSNWSVFAQPQYSRSFLYLGDGLGPYDDKVHTYSIFTGVRVRIF